jgi:hypothetical protein
MFMNGQATKGSRWIPRHTEAKKDVATDDKLGELEARIDPEVSEWGNPITAI